MIVTLTILERFQCWKSDSILVEVFTNQGIVGIGGATQYGRGGILAAPYFEWGGHNTDGSWGLPEKRPGVKPAFPLPGRPAIGRGHPGSGEGDLRVLDLAVEEDADREGLAQRRADSVVAVRAGRKRKRP